MTKDYLSLWMSLVITGIITNLISLAEGTITCYDCTGFHCASLIQKGYAGTCTSNLGKCFYRVDPNGLEYRGCADTRIWPGQPRQLDMAYTGCRHQRYGGWHNTNVKWCFCGFELCNINEMYLLRRQPLKSTGKITSILNDVGNTKVPAATKPPRKTITRTKSNGVRWAAPSWKAKKKTYTRPAVTVSKSKNYAMFLQGKGKGPAPQAQTKSVTPVTQAPIAVHRWQRPKVQAPIPNMLHNKGTSHHTHTGTGQGAGMGMQLLNDLTKFLKAKKVMSTDSPYTEAATTAATTPQPPTTTPETFKQTTGYKFVNNNNNNINIHGFDGVTHYPLHSTPPTNIFTDDLVGAGGKEAQKPDVKPTINGAGKWEPYGSCKRANCEHRCDMSGGKPVCSCRKGYTLAADRTRCDDENECNYGRGGCSHDCVNLIGSYMCDCPPGYTIDSDERQCIDFNECRYLDNMNCQHNCQNTAGSYHCSCRKGYHLNIDGKTCNDIDECRLGNHDCDHICHSNSGSYSCACFHGYYLAPNGRNCLDINECVVNKAGCAHTCTNTAGGFECGCHQGYAPNVDSRMCDDVNECVINNGGCEQTCTNTLGSFTCGCQQGYAWNGRMCIDVNECRVDNGGCEQICENLQGRHTCSCRKDFTLSLDQKSCDSDDACLRANGGCEHVCTSMASGARCSCHQGHMLDIDGLSCIDINECRSQNGGCSQICSNSMGSYTCTCQAGWAIDVDGRTCNDNNECGSNNGGCQHLCKNQDGGHVCDCRSGYTLATDRKSCTDINECYRNNGGCEDQCSNSPGSYSCQCTGDLQSINTDGRTCSVDCPSDFTKVDELQSCYKVFSGDTMALSVGESQSHCSSLHNLATLTNIESDQERTYLKDIMKREGTMLEGWQGWWTGGLYNNGMNKFQWMNGEFIDDHWGFQRKPFEETCVWVLQIPIYNYTYGNYDCTTRTGFICELELSKLSQHGG